MPKKTNPATAAAVLTLEALLGDLKASELKKISDVGVRDLLLQLYALLCGLYAVLVEGTTPEQQLVAKSLAEVNITLDDGKDLVAAGEDLWALMKDRDDKAEKATAATNKLDLAKARLHTEVQSYSSIIRSQLGTRSPALEQFGIKKLGTVHTGPRPRKDKKAEAHDDGGSKDATPPAKT